jgi:hypothetical protein
VHDPNPTPCAGRQPESQYQDLVRPEYAPQESLLHDTSWEGRIAPENRTQYMLHYGTSVRKCVAYRR